ncbi:fimbrial protein [Aeromonas cavernicola]|uniref:Fimbrial protein n=1 Tax=Aeromonas cavernicola TaxID=1006623 RepID=A0A2H9U4P3_9GAMM|nr:fimbrial protein [Aeromonas cavernicola]PJG58958.1 fimbrial protein [Aeromonas cavernicola]
MKTQFNVTRTVRTLVTSSATALMLAMSMVPASASAADGVISFTGAIYESPCDFSNKSVTCYLGTNTQSIDLARLQKVGTLKSISSTLNYATSASDKNVAFVTVSYL